MAQPETFISILSFVLNSVLLSGFIIPQVQKLKEIKDKVIKFKITYISESGSSGVDRIALKKEQDKEIEQLHNLLDSYRIRTNELKSLVRVFYVAVILALIAITITFLWGSHELKIRNISFALSDLTTLAHAILQFVILLFAIKIYSTSPNKLQDVSYLAREMDINPHSLVSALRLSLHIANPKSFRERGSREDPLSVFLNMDLRAFGFRFLYVVSGKDSKVYYTSFGPITSKTRLMRYRLPGNELMKKDEYNQIEIGSFQFNLIEEKQDLDIMFLVFLPFYKQEKLSPMVFHTSFEVPGRDSGRYTISQSGGGMWSINTMRTNDNIIYRGQGIKIYELQYTGAKDDLLNKVIDHFRNGIMNSRKIKQYSDIRGRILKQASCIEC